MPGLTGETVGLLAELVEIPMGCDGEAFFSRFFSGDWDSSGLDSGTAGNGGDGGGGGDDGGWSLLLSST